MNRHSTADRPEVLRASSTHRRKDGARQGWALLAFVAMSLLPREAGAVSYRYTPIADTTGGVFQSFQSLSLNAAGAIAFYASTGGGYGIYVGDGVSTRTVISPTDPNFSPSHLGYPSINDAGTVAFRAAEVRQGTNYRGIYTWANGTVSLARQETYAQAWLHLNNSDVIAYQGENAAVTLRRANGALVEQFSFPGSSNLGSLNNLNQFSVYNAEAQTRSIFTVDSASRTWIVIADTRESFTSLGTWPSLNDSGSTAFNAHLSGGGQGVLIGNGNQTGPAVADSSGPYDTFGTNLSLNNVGVLAYAAWSSTIAQPSGIFVGNTLRGAVVRNGDSLFGSTVTAANIYGESLNDSGQVAFTYMLANGRRGIARAEPEFTSGDAPWMPVLPDEIIGDTFVFRRARPDNPLTAGWYDPPMTHGYTFEVLGGTFVQVAGPPGFDNLHVIVDGMVVETDLDAGESFYFEPNTRTFSIANIDPAVEASDPTAFPTFLAFNGEPTELRMTALVTTVPEPQSWALLLGGIALLSAWRHSARSRGGFKSEAQHPSQ